jgi:DNA-binding HxlR family transcriptional regulator
VIYYLCCEAYYLAKHLSDAGHRILFLISTAKDQNGLSFNELRGPPYRLNPKTLARQLRRLHSWRLITRRVETVRGGKRYRYTLTPQGELFLEHPISVHDLDRVLYQTISRVLGSDSKMENRMCAMDLVTKPPDEYQIGLTVNLSWDHDTCNVVLHWEKRGEQVQLKERPRILLRDRAGHPPDAKA